RGPSLPSTPAISTIRVIGGGRARASRNTRSRATGPTMSPRIRAAPSSMGEGDDEPPFFTIGHSNRSIADFLALLGEAGVEVVVDIRKMPMSRAHPHFNGAALSGALAEAGIG